MLPVLFGENLFDDFFNDDFDRRFWNEMRHTGRELYGKHGKNLMKTDIRETDSTYELDVDLPGFAKDEVAVDLKDGYLTISAQKKAEKPEEKKEGKYIRQERCFGSCARSFYVGDLKPEDVKCKFDSGVLQISVPKEAPKQIPASTRIAIE